MNFFKEEIKNKLKNHTVEPPQDSWEFISKELNSNTPAYPKFYQWGAAAAILLLILLGWWFYPSHPEKNTEIPNIVQEEILENKSDKIDQLQPPTLSTDSLEDKLAKQNQIQQQEKIIQNNSNALELHTNKNQESLLQQKSLVKDHKTKSFRKNQEIALKTDQWLVDEEKESITSNDFAIGPDVDKKVDRKEDSNLEKNKFLKPLKITPKTKIENSETIIASNEDKVNDEGLDETQNSLETEDEEKSLEILKDKKANKFVVSGYAGNWDLLKSNPNLISPELESYPTQSKNAIEYGVLLTYAPTSKLKISGGVGVLNLEQNSSNIPIKVDYNLVSNDVGLKVDVPKGGLQHDAPVVTDLMNRAASSESSPKTGILNQQMRFVQIPVELSYDFMSSNKWNWSVVGGTNFMFLEQNEIQLNYLKRYEDANYLSDAPNFSVGIKLGTKFIYQFTPNIGLFIQPEAMQMLNTFGDVDNKINVGFKTGISIGL